MQGPSIQHWALDDFDPEQISETERLDYPILVERLNRRLRVTAPRELITGSRPDVSNHSGPETSQAGSLGASYARVNDAKGLGFQ